RPTGPNNGFRRSSSNTPRAKRRTRRVRNSTGSNSRTIMPRRAGQSRFRPEAADEQGLVAIDGDLAPAILLDAYRSGVFPWYDENTPICWWSPDPRAIIPLDGLHVSRRLARTIRGGRFTVTFNRDFAGVIRGCAHRPGEGTWLVPEMIDAYRELHRLGHAHSVEV